MDDCILKRKNQVLHLLNSTGAVYGPSLNWNDVDEGLYDSVLKNASIFGNETLTVCNKSAFLVVSRLRILQDLIIFFYPLLLYVNVRKQQSDTMESSLSSLIGFCE